MKKSSSPDLHKIDICTSIFQNIFFMIHLAAASNNRSNIFSNMPLCMLVLPSFPFKMSKTLTKKSPNSNLMRNVVSQIWCWYQNSTLLSYWMKIRERRIANLGGEERQHFARSKEIYRILAAARNLKNRRNRDRTRIETIQNAVFFGGEWMF